MTTMTTVRMTLAARLPQAVPPLAVQHGTAMETSTAAVSVTTPDVAVMSCTTPSAVPTAPPRTAITTTTLFPLCASHPSLVPPPPSALATATTTAVSPL